MRNFHDQMQENFLFGNKKFKFISDLHQKMQMNKKLSAKKCGGKRKMRKTENSY